MAVSLEPFDGFWCFNFWVKALDVYFHPMITAGPSDPYNRHNTAAASYGQHCPQKSTIYKTTLESHLLTDFGSMEKPQAILCKNLNKVFRAVQVAIAD